MNYPKKPGFSLYQSRHCAYITYSVKTWFLTNLSVCTSQGLHIFDIGVVNKIVSIRIISKNLAWRKY